MEENEHYAVTAIGNSLSDWTLDDRREDGQCIVLAMGGLWSSRGQHLIDVHSRRLTLGNLWRWW